MFFLRKLIPLNRLHYCRQSLPDFITKKHMPYFLYIYVLCIQTIKGRDQQFENIIMNIKVSSFGYSGRCKIYT